MKIAVTAKGDSLDDQMSFRLGRCSYYLIIDTESDEVEAIENPDLSGDEEVSDSCASLISQRKVRAVVTGHCGPEAHRIFGSIGIKVFPGMTGMVSDVLEKVKKMQKGEPAQKQTARPSAVSRQKASSSVEKVVFPYVTEKKKAPAARKRPAATASADPVIHDMPGGRRVVEIEPGKELYKMRMELGVMGKKIQEMQARMEMLERLFQ
ncbi:MAG: hypothetical protein EOL87_08485 [Spartobacteria bacterium]|nr:hypothetical protein [Spartobacteria bacterium]